VHQTCGECDLCLLQQPASQSVVRDTEQTGVSTGSAEDADGSDLLQNLLGVADARALDKMLDSADSAAALLGVRTEQNSVSAANDVDEVDDELSQTSADNI